MATVTVTTYLCIGCPLGCRLEVESIDSDVIEVRGFGCRIGKEFGVQEHTNPTRMVTTTVRVVGGKLDRLPVKTKRPIPKEKVLPLADELHRLEVRAPVHRGDVVLANALGTGVDVVATRDVDVSEGNDNSRF